MRPVRNARTRFDYRGDHLGHEDLPCWREGGVVYSSWEPTPEERIAIAEGANILLGIYSEPIPPVSLSVDPTPREV